MVWKFAVLLIASCLALAGAAKADVTPVCFDPGTARLSPEGYRALDALAEERTPPNHIRLFAGGRAGEGLTAERLEEMQLELLRNDVFLGSIETVADSGTADPDCLGAEVSRGGTPFLRSWHFYGPFFETGSDTITQRWRDAMRFFVAAYRPGRLRFCVEGYSDTQGAVGANMVLSRRRAENTALELVRQGVRFEDIDIRWLGESRLARPTADGVAEAMNRRVLVDLRQRCPDAAR